ncbi:transcription factor Gibbin [Corythoichthys intestinalis]|uniref:transcription factor Gibbin n=1 Tax=Corythoichthys intestinalis TaxID=161448 RepID=UPI0025A543D5|nr:transcription factor Gibbin [Corythoichthys intestinalis]XP_057683347.1 transcription factor Gibbin [Corythoichthys intestinalis]
MAELLAQDDPSPVTADLSSVAPTLANGVHPQRRGKNRSCPSKREATGSEPPGSMQTHIDTQTLSPPNLDSCGPVEAQQSRTQRTTSPQSLSLALGNHPTAANQAVGRTLDADMEIPANVCPSTGPSPLIVEAERKYALRSSGRSRFPCHVRKSSRLRRTLDEDERRAEKERPNEEAVEAFEEKIWRVKEEQVEEAVLKKEQPSLAPVIPTAVCPADVPLALTVPKMVPKATPKLGPRLGHRPGPKSRSRPGPKSVQRPGPKSVMRQRLAAQAALQGGATHFPPPVIAPLLKKELQIFSPNGRRCGRFVGVRRIVVKVARIPVNLGRRQKSYKISNLETFAAPEKGGTLEGPEVAKEPTALLRMKNNGKSVMVMFPPGELPLIVKRRRGRPPKQPIPLVSGEVPATCGDGEQLKKPRRRRRTKLPCPYPSYVSDTNDIKTEYGDVLSKLAFLNRQPPTTGRCSPPRCWTPSEPESFHTPSENPGISALLHRLTGFRRPRGSRGGGAGRGGATAGGAGNCEHNKSTFCDFFESIGKKRKLSPLTEHGLPRKRGKGVGGVGRGGGVVGTEPGGEKTVRKRRVRKNGTLKGEGGCMGQDWPNGAGGWGAEDTGKRYELCRSTRGGFSSGVVGRRGAYSRGSRVVRQVREDSQSLFAGYFRSLLDSDDSSELLDISQSNARKASSGHSYESSSPASGHQWSTAIPKWGANGASCAADSPAQTHGSSAGPPYSYASQNQTSPTPSAYLKSTPPSLSHSPSSPHPASYGHYSPAYAASSCAGPQRSSDCSFSYNSSGKTLVHDRGQIGYSGYQSAARKGYTGSPATGPISPSGGYMSVAKGGTFSSSSSPECYKQYTSNQWSLRQGYGGWSADNFGSHAYSEYGSNESKDILDISNYTPQKSKRPPFPESLSESSSDSSHPGSGAAGSGTPSMGGVFKQSETVSGEGAPSSLSSLEKLMIDWHESASAPSYNWSQNVLFQGGGTSKPGRGRRKRIEQTEKEGASVLHSDSPSSPSPTLTPKRGGAGGRGRGSRGGRGGISGCPRERLSGSKGRGKAAASSSGLEASGLFQEGLDYYSGDSSSLSPLATPNSAPPSTYLQDPCEYPSPYSAHPSTPSSEERYPALYPGESSSSLSPGVSSPPYPAKSQSYHLAPSRNFSPSCSPLPRVTPHCSSAMSPSYRPPPKEAPFSQYDSPSYCGSPYWYGQTSHSSTPSPSTHPHTSPHANTHGNLLASPNAHMNPPPHEPQHHLSSHAKPYPGNSLTHAHTNNQPHLGTQAAAHSAPSLYEECSTATTHKQELMPRQGLLTSPPYTKSNIEEDSGAYSLSHVSCQAMGHRYPSQASQQGTGVLCQLLDQGHDDGFSVTSL